MPTMAEIFKKKYCLGDSLNCARHRVFEIQGREKVPMDMFPNDNEYADTILIVA